VHPEVCRNEIYVMRVKKANSFTIFFLPDNISCMVKREKKKIKFKKVVSEQFPINVKRGGGILKIEAWENEKGKIVKYSMAYINHLKFSGDNGRVLGYDNTHNFHHKHYFGEISEVLNFTTYKALVDRFEKEIKELIK